MVAPSEESEIEARGDYPTSSASARRSPLIGRPEALVRFPWLDAELWRAVDHTFPVRVPRGYVGDARDPEDPRLLMALPSAEELRPDAGDREDPVGDLARSPLPWVVQKHEDRLLVLLTKRCHLTCRYCFRRNHEPGAHEDPTTEEWQAVLEFVRRSAASELILSGGDPLAVRDERLFEIVDAGRGKTIRIHTRAPIALPSRVTPELVAGLRARAPVWLLVHVNHAVELGPEVEAALGRLVDGGLPVLNQAVLLAGVNDDVDVLAELSRRLVALRVYPYYLHHPDHAAGNAHFRVDPRRGLALMEALRARVSGIGLPAYVVDLPDGSGKIPVERWLREGAEVSLADGRPSRDPSVP